MLGVGHRYDVKQEKWFEHTGTTLVICRPEATQHYTHVKSPRHVMTDKVKVIFI
jgi:hypothetical protein